MEALSGSTRIAKTGWYRLSANDSEQNQVKKYRIGFQHSYSRKRVKSVVGTSPVYLREIYIDCIPFTYNANNAMNSQL